MHSINHIRTLYN